MKYIEITVRGTNYEMGLQYGKQCKEHIKKCLEDLLKGKNRTELLSKTWPFKPFFQKYSPQYLEEINGIRDGAGISMEEALYLQVRWEIAYATLMQVGNECTTYVLGNRVTTNGEYFAGINKDVNEWSRENMVVLKMIPEEGPRLMVLAYVGTMAGNGINGYGVGFFGNSIWSKEAGFFGIPQPLFFRVLLSQDNIENCITATKKIMDQKEIGFSGNFLICDAKQDMASIEIINGKYDVIRPQQDAGYIIHTNHLLSRNPELGAMEDITQLEESRGRLGRLYQMVEKNKGHIDYSYLKSILSDHANYPGSICSHLDTRQTAASMIVWPQQKKMKVSKGNPCQNEYFDYQL